MGSRAHGPAGLEGRGRHRTSIEGGTAEAGEAGVEPGDTGMASHRHEVRWERSREERERSREERERRGKKWRRDGVWSRHLRPAVLQLSLPQFHPGGGLARGNVRRRGISTPWLLLPSLSPPPRVPEGSGWLSGGETLGLSDGLNGREKPSFLVFKILTFPKIVWGVFI